MPFSDNCDVFGAVHENGLNRVVGHAMRQRPSLFNYGTDLFISRPELLCEQIQVHPEVQRRGNPLLTRENPLPVPGTNGAYGIDFCLQVTKLAVDFHPGNTIALPPELSPLGLQRAALTARACLGLVCPPAAAVEALGDALADGPPQGSGPQTIPGGTPHCFCLDVFAVARTEQLLRPEGLYLVMRLDGFEIVDIQPTELEDALECYVETALRLGVLPRLRFLVSSLVFDLASFLKLSVGLVPVSAAVPNNPAIEDDELKVFVRLGVGP